MDLAIAAELRHGWMLLERFKVQASEFSLALLIGRLVE